MRFASIVSLGLKALLLGILSFAFQLQAQSNVTIRVMAANLNGNTQSYQPFALRIFQGLKPDVVAIQEFNYTSTNGLGANTPAALREMVDATFGTNYAYFRESGYNIPNGVISRYPILNSGSWTDTQVSDRAFVWAQIDLPGTNDLYIVSVHLLTSSASARGTEAGNLKTLIQANFPTNAWIVVAGDFNTDSRTESPAMPTFESFLSDYPVPADNNGNSDTSINRNHPHDFVLPSFNLTNYETVTTFATLTYTNGLVFDSRVYNATDLSANFSPVQSADSGLAQHMAVMKDFFIPDSTNSTTATTNAPAITIQPQSITVSPGNNASITVTASGTAPLAYQWLFNGTNISGATTNPLVIVSVQFTNAGGYSVIITNLAGSITSSNAVLTVTNTPPSITTQPQSQSVSVGASPTFIVAATGSAPLSYQWLLGSTNIPGANTNFYTRGNVQTNDAGNYAVIVTNLAGSVTSSVATLTVTVVSPNTSTNIIAQWNFNSLISDAAVGTGTRAASIGTGTNSYVGGTAAAGSGEFATGSTAADTNPTDNSAWNTSTYPAAAANNTNAGVKFTVSTAGRQNIVITWASQTSSTGSKYGRLQYTIDGTNFLNFPTAVTNPTAFTIKTNSLIAIPGVNNNTNFAFRIVTEFEFTATGAGLSSYVASGTYGTGGTIRFDMVTVLGSLIVTNTPATPANLSTPVLSPGQIQFNLAGTTGANYIVQVSTNLAATNWVSLLTNISPYTFTDTNLNAAQKFYRAVSSP